MTKSTLQAALLVVLSAVLLFSFTHDSFARERSAGGAFTTGKGKSGTYSTNITAKRGEGRTRASSVTTSTGNTYNRSANTMVNKTDGTYTRNVTGANGKTRTINGTASKGQSSGTYTTSTGKSGTYDSSTQKNGDGSITHSDTWVNQNGETKTRTGTYTYDKNTNTLNGTVTGARGQTRDGSVTVVPTTR